MGILIMLLSLRSNVMRAKDEKIIYIARNLVCDGATAYDTGFKPFYGDDASKDFKITVRLGSYTRLDKQDVVMGCKYEGTTGGQQYPGFYWRQKNNNYSIFEIGGFNYWTPTITSILGHKLCIWRAGGAWKAQIDNGAIQNLSVRVASFNQSIVIGAGVQTSGTYFRYSNCVIDYIRIEYL